MKRGQPIRWVGRAVGCWPSWREFACALLFAVAAAGAAPALAQVPDPESESPQPAAGDTGESQKGHGSVSIAYQNTYVNGMLIGESVMKIGTVRVQTIDLGVDYYVADQWSINAGIPFTSSRFNGTGIGPAHCPTTAPPICQSPTPALSPQEPGSQFLDDGNVHGTWADWSFGAAYHTEIDNYLITPSITAYIPSHNYTFFANAAVGQDLKKVEIGATVAHQFDFSNFYYRIGYRYAFEQKTLGISVDNSKVDLDLGYFVNEKLSVNLFGLGKFGGGLTSDELIQLTKVDGIPFSNEFWYHHDQISAHEYFNVGTGMDYRFGDQDKYTLTTNLQRLIWGNSVYDFKYKFDVTLTRAF
jgi:hypothetical protein